MEVYVRLGQSGGKSYQSTKGNVAPMVERQFEGLGDVGSSPTVTTKKGKQCRMVRHLPAKQYVPLWYVVRFHCFPLIWLCTQCWSRGRSAKPI